MVAQDHPIAVISPNGGEIVHKPNLPVSWITNTALAGTSVSVELWNAAGLVRTLGTDADPSGIHTVTFDSTDIPDGQDYRIKVISGRKPQYTDLSDGPFRIANAPAAGTNVYFSLESDVDYGTGVARLTRSNLLQFPVKVTDAAAYPVGLAVDPPGNFYYGLVHADEAGQDFSYEIVKRTTRGETVSYGTVFHPVHGDPTWALDLAASAQGELFFTHYDDPTLGTGTARSTPAAPSGPCSSRPILPSDWRSTAPTTSISASAPPLPCPAPSTN